MSLAVLLLVLIIIVEIREHSQKAYKSLILFKQLALPKDSQIVSIMARARPVENGNNCASEIELHLQSNLPVGELYAFYNNLSRSTQKFSFIQRRSYSLSENSYVLIFIDYSTFEEFTLICSTL